MRRVVAAGALLAATAVGIWLALGSPVVSLALPIVALGFIVGFVATAIWQISDRAD